jgi:metal-responsive CopG/Arc/MetJ family transcriptional regulator
LKLIRDGDRDMDGTQEERDELIKDIYNQYISYRDHQEKEEELSASKGPKTGIISMTEDCDASKIYYGLWFSNK